jgi:hypothetical protein
VPENSSGGRSREGEVVPNGDVRWAMGEAGPSAYAQTQAYHKRVSELGSGLETMVQAGPTRRAEGTFM